MDQNMRVPLITVLFLAVFLLSVFGVNTTQGTMKFGREEFRDSSSIQLQPICCT